MATLRELVTKLRYVFTPESRDAARRYKRTAQDIRREQEKYGYAADKAGDADERLARRRNMLVGANTRLIASNGRLRASFAAFNAQTIGIFGAAFTAKAVTDAGRSLDELENRIRAVESRDAPIRTIRRDLARISASNFADIANTAQIYQRFRIGTDDLGKNRQQILDFTEYVQRSAASSGSNPNEVNAALIQFAQGIASNRFSGEEFRSVAEQTPTILKVLRKHLTESTGERVTMAELRELAYDGQLTASTIFEAFESQRGYIDGIWDNYRVSRDNAVSFFKTGLLTFFGSFTQASGFNDNIRDMLLAIGTWFNDNEKLARKLGMFSADLFVVIGDGIATMFGGVGGREAITKTFKTIRDGLSNLRQFSRAYAQLRENGFGRFDAAKIAVEGLFGEEAFEKLRKFVDALRPVGRAIATIFASRLVAAFVGAVVGAARAMGPLIAAATLLSAVWKAAQIEGGGIQKLLHELKLLFAAFGAEGSIVTKALKFGFDVLVVAVSALAAMLADIVKIIRLVVEGIDKAIGAAGNLKNAVVDKFTTSDEEREEKAAKKAARRERKQAAKDNRLRALAMRGKRAKGKQVAQIVPKPRQKPVTKPKLRREPLMLQPKTQKQVMGEKLASSGIIEKMPSGAAARKQRRNNIAGTNNAEQIIAQSTKAAVTNNVTQTVNVTPEGAAELLSAARNGDEQLARDLENSGIGRGNLAVGGGAY